MIFSHDIELSLRGVVGLVNTGEPGTALDVDALRQYVATYEVSDAGEVDAAVAAEVRAVRDALREVFSAGSDREAAALLNEVVSRAPVTPRLTDHDGYAWHVHYFAPGASLAEHLAVDGGMALALVVAGGERDRLRRCEAPDCSHVLVDLSRNRSRRYCDSRTCGNRLHVAAYRERRRAG